MKKLLLSCLCGLLLPLQSFAALPFVQQTIMQNAVSATGNGTELDVRGFDLVNLEITISATATVEIEVAQKTSGTYYSLKCVDSATGAVSASTYTAAASNVRCNVAGLGALRARVSARTSGTITVTGTVITIGSVATLGGSVTYPFGYASNRTGAQYNILKLGALNIPQNATYYASGIGTIPNATEINRQIAIGEYSEVTVLRVFLNANVPAANSLVVTIRKNGVSVAGATCTVAAVTSTCSVGMSGIAIFEKGDLLSVQLVASATFTNTIDAGIALVLIANVGENAGYGVPAIWYSIFSSSSGLFIGEFAHSVTENLLKVPISASRVFNTGIANIGSASGDRAAVVVRNNGVTVHEGVTASTTSLPVAGVEGLPVLFVDNDLLSLIEATGAIGGDIYNGFVRVSSVTPFTTYPSIPMLFSITTQAQNTTRYFGGWGNAGQSATENNVQIPITTCNIGNLRVVISAAPAAGQTYTVTVRKDGVATALTVQFTSASATILSYTATTDSFIGGQLLSIESVASATAGTRILNASVECAA